jgi:hypothetical protein
VTRTTATVEKQPLINQSLVSLQLKGGAGIYFVNITDCTSGKQVTKKVIVE